MIKLVDDCLIIDDNGGSLLLNQYQIEYTDSFGEQHYYNIDDIRMIEINANTMISSPVIEECIRSGINIIFEVDGKTYVPYPVI